MNPSNSQNSGFLGHPKALSTLFFTEVWERFSFYGMKAALAIFLAHYIGILGGDNLSETEATKYVAICTLSVYFTLAMFRPIWVVLTRKSPLKKVLPELSASLTGSALRILGPL